MRASAFTFSRIDEYLVGIQLYFVTLRLSRTTVAGTAASNPRTTSGDRHVKSGTMLLLEGWLRGMAHEATCDILARRVEVSAQDGWRRIFAYHECNILTAPNDLPDGDYMAYFAGHSFPVNRTRGLWTSLGEAVPDSYARNLPEGRTVVPVQPPATPSPQSDDEDHTADLRPSPPSPRLGR